MLCKWIWPLRLFPFWHSSGYKLFSWLPWRETRLWPFSSVPLLSSVTISVKWPETSTSRRGTEFLQRTLRWAEHWLFHFWAVWQFLGFFYLQKELIIKHQHFQRKRKYVLGSDAMFQVSFLKNPEFSKLSKDFLIRTRNIVFKFNFKISKYFTQKITLLKQSLFFSPKWKCINLIFGWNSIFKWRREMSSGNKSVFQISQVHIRV